MKFFSECSGPCAACAVGNACLAGHGDDDFVSMSRAKLEEILRTGVDPYGMKESEDGLRKIRAFCEKHYGKGSGL